MTSPTHKDGYDTPSNEPAEDDQFQEEFLAAGAICDHCDNAACGSLSWNTDWSPTECEDFGPHFHGSTRVARNSIISPSSDKGRPERLGLCRSCDQLANCTRPKPMSGVWDCDDYK